MLARIGCTVNEDKNENDKEGLLFAGLYIFPGGVGPNRLKVGQLLQIPPPTTKKAMQSALGLVSYLRDYIPLVSHFTRHLCPGKTTPLLEANEYKKEGRRLLNQVRSAANTLRH